MNTKPATLDFETYSATLIKDGAWRYSVDPEADIICMCWHLPGTDKIYRWAPVSVEGHTWDDPKVLFKWVERGGLIEAHNVLFEYAIWTNVLCKRHPDRPELPLASLRCSAAKAAAHSLPRALAKVANALDVEQQKSDTGKALIHKYALPNKKGQRSEIPEEDLLAFVEYCAQDVKAEMAISAAIPDLSPTELKVFQADLAINTRGFCVDREATRYALEKLPALAKRGNDRLAEITEGEVERVTQRQRLKTWLNETAGLDLPSTEKHIIARVLEQEGLTPEVREVLEILADIGRSSQGKYAAAERWVDPNTSLIHGGLIYHGASTGRWSGAGLQPHNFIRGNIKDMDATWADLLAGRVPESQLMRTLAEATRGIITARPGRKLVVADYSAIEARVLVVLAGDDDAVQVFKNGECIYCDMAESIYHKPINKVDNPDERMMGKQAILGLGYRMGAAKFQQTLKDKYAIDISKEFADLIVTAYRQKYYLVENLWDSIERCAIKAVRHPGRVTGYNGIAFKVEGRFLYCKLPSGRKLAYADPVIKGKITPWGEKRPALFFMATNPYSRRWELTSTYSGMLVENIVQATARDIMAAAILNIEASGNFRTILTVHDEVVTEAREDDDEANPEALCGLMCKKLPSWCDGWPIDAEGWEGFRYKKG